MIEADIQDAHMLSKAVQWPHRQEDWAFAFEVGQGFVAEQAGRVVGTALYWQYGESKATLGLVIIAPELQGQGAGRRLLELAIKQLGQRETFLYATEAGKVLYEKLGFKSCGDLTQHQGIAKVAPRVDPLPGERVRVMSPADFPAIVGLEARASRFERAAMLASLLPRAAGVVLENNGEILGFSFLRRYGHGFSIGPVVAQPSECNTRVKALIAHWMDAYSSEFLRMDVPGGTGINEWLVEHGLLSAGTVITMARNARDSSNSSACRVDAQLYGVINQAMG